MYIFKVISKILSALVSVVIIASIVMTMGWHKSPVAKPVIEPAKKLYTKLVTGEKEQGVVYGAFKGLKNMFGPFGQRIINNLIDFVTMTLPKYVLLTIIGLVIVKKTKLVNWLT